ncbi:MAG TPA: GNAT family N-acetyltransferase [Longimicrobiaceae bacterium]|nr:GNAT family N-acetyltransferase [Longimicrobiaceae bacterium]
MDFRVCRFYAADAFLARAESWLLRAEAEHNLLLGLAHRLRASAEGYEPPIYLATVEDADGVVGCAFRTPPFKLGLTRIPAGALPALVEDVAAVYPSLPAVLGPEPEARRFAELWAERKGNRARPGMRQRIFQLDRVIWPERQPAGTLRVAGPEDRELVEHWMWAFSAEAGTPTHRIGRMAEERIRERAIFLWEDPEPCSMAGWVGQSPNGVRIGYVYTPLELRGRGYASACVAQASQRALDAGCRFCFLYTDLANPTSNSIYRRIGYQPVCDVVDWHLEEEAS